MSGLGKPKILLTSTLNPYPFWAGSEKFWFHLLINPKTFERFQFHARLADSPETRKQGDVLRRAGAEISFYKHFNESFVLRNLSRLRDRMTESKTKTLPWYDEIENQRYDLAWFCVSTTREILDLKYAVAKCRRTNTPYWISIQHSYEEIFLSDEHELNVITDIVNSAVRLVFIAERNRKSLERAIGVRLKNVHHSTNTITSAALDRISDIVANRIPGREESARFYSLGRYAPRDKGQHLLVEALSNPTWRSRNWRLTFIGFSGYGERQVRQQADYFGIDQERIEMTPFTDNVFTEIAQHDVLLMPSLAEGTPYAMIESMACGRPAVGTPVGGIPELIRDGETGWLARTVDVADVSDVLERCWQDRERWAEMGRTAREFVIENLDQGATHALLLDQLAQDAKRA